MRALLIADDPENTPGHGQIIDVSAHPGGPPPSISMASDPAIQTGPITDENRDKPSDMTAPITVFTLLTHTKELAIYAQSTNAALNWLGTNMLHREDLLYRATSLNPLVSEQYDALVRITRIVGGIKTERKGR